MKRIIRQFRRMFVDDGRNDRDFSEQDQKLRAARKILTAAAVDLKRAAGILSDVLHLRDPDNGH